MTCWGVMGELVQAWPTVLARRVRRAWRAGGCLLGLLIAGATAQAATVRATILPAITQEQADLLLANQPANGRGFGLGGDFGGRGMNGGRGMMPGMPGMDGGHGFGHGMHGMPGDQDDDDTQDSQQDDSGAQGDTSLVPNFGL